MSLKSIRSYVEGIKRAAIGVLIPRQLTRTLARLRFHDDGVPVGRRALNGARIVKYPANGSRP